MASLARWCFRNRGKVLTIWIILLIGIGVGANRWGDSYNTSFSMPGTDSTKALSLLQSMDAKAAGDSDQIVLHALGGTKLTDPAVEQSVETMLGKVAKIHGIVGASDPYAEVGGKPSGAISSDGTIGYSTVRFQGNQATIKLDDVKSLVSTAQSVAGSKLEVELGGQDIAGTEQSSTGSSEQVGYIAALIVLLLAFGSLVGALLPIVVAIFGLGVGTSLIVIASHGLTIPALAPILAALIGIGVGIDYALFIVTRFRNGVRSGLTHEESVVRALDTSGRAVVFAGTTVCIALLGMLTTRMSFLSGTGVGAAIAVATVVLAAITLLPALLGFRPIGKRVLSRSARRKLRASGPVTGEPTGMWARWAKFVEKRPKILALAAVVVMGVLLIPTLSVRLGSSDQGNDPSTTTTRKAYDLLAEGFGPGFNGPLVVVAQLGSSSDDAAVTQLAAQIRTQPDVVAVIPAPVVQGSSIATITVVPGSSPEAVQTTDLVNNLRDNVVPKAEQGTTMHAYVGGTTAIYEDFASVMKSKVPLFVGVVVALGFLLLMIAFRSLLVPLAAAVMNLLAAGASFGVIVWIFQYGHGSDTLGLGAAGPVEAWLPVMMLSILFGLSMDYQVFLVSRMHEEWVHTKDNRRAVRVGQAETGRVITAAATIMMCVFLSFLLLGQRPVAEFGIGLTAAVALDAFVLRMLLVPSLMQMLGKANWWLPGWLDRILPHFSVEGDGTPPVGKDYLDPDLFRTRAERKAAKAAGADALPGQQAGEAEEDAAPSGRR
ncbi:MMPL family transporter [Actinospica sp. MGRD01-02]|uniref:MMPL family transporter n=1 Tax=Actinospica acidithermotolerans TaxID=2828514 RepID=A0A941EGG9_9ACTN|nr:MMPL family transporter [Actinospica acidithermotolerans]MBR7831016.1 MMPL family transporter [Actinospica acidithermotolerans]